MQSRGAVGSKSNGLEQSRVCRAAQRSGCLLLQETPAPHLEHRGPWPPLAPCRGYPSSTVGGGPGQKQGGTGRPGGRGCVPEQNQCSSGDHSNCCCRGSSPERLGTPFLLIGKKGVIGKEKTTYDPKDESLNKHGCCVLRSARYCAKPFPYKTSWPLGKITERCPYDQHSKITLHS